LGLPPAFGVPPVPGGGGVHDGGSVSFPMQSSHVPHVLLHCALCTHVGHFVGSLMSASEQVLTMWIVVLPPPGSGILQQPKQSQPFGVNCMQNLRHCCVSVQSGLVCASFPVRQSVL
jgi:hypothetical protein